MGNITTTCSINLLPSFVVVPGQPSKKKSVDAQDSGANSEKSEAARGKEEEGHEPGKKGKKK